MSNHVFVSHSHQDAPGAGLIVDALEKRGVKCWIAPRDVAPGGSYAESILNAIESASCFVLVYSQHSNVSSHVLREVERALKFELNIVPIRFDDSAPSKSLDYLLATVHWLSVAPGNSQSIAKAAEQIAACIPTAGNTAPGVEPARRPSPQPLAAAPTRPRPKRNPIWIAVALVIAASLIYWLVSKNSVDHTTRETASSGPASSPAATVTAEPTELPVAVTHRYFSLLAKRNATAAYNLLSEEFRRHLSIAKYSRSVGFKPVVTLAETSLVSKTDKAATVAAVFEDTDPAANKARWKGNIDFVLESGTWRIDSMKGLYPSSGRPIHDAEEETAPSATQPATTPVPTPTPAPSPTPSPIPSPTPAPQKMRGIVKSSEASLHKRPHPKAEVVTPLKEDEKLEIDRIEGDWIHATTEEKKSGWVHKSKVKINP